jgi:hypothetical protein
MDSEPLPRYINKKNNEPNAITTDWIEWHY